MKKLSMLAGAFILLLLGITSCNQTEQKQREDTGLVTLSNPMMEATSVFLTTDNQGLPVANWVEIDSTQKKYLFFSKWDTQKRRFGTPRPIPIEQNMATHEEGMPKIAFKGDGTMLAVYEVSTPKEGTRFGIGEVHYIRSKDNGKTWTAPKPVYGDNRGVLSYGFGNIIRMANGEIGAAALGTDLSPDRVGRPIVFTRTDGDNGFIPPVVVEPRACECCRTALAADASGRVGLVYRDLLPGSVRDISISYSTDNGTDFQQPEDFSKDHWAVNGCPHNGPAVVMRDGKTFATWYSGGAATGVHYGELDSTGKMIRKIDISNGGRFIQLGILPDGVRIAAYSADYRQGDSVFSKIVVNKIDDQNGFYEKEITKPKAQASYPMVQAIDNKDVIVAWEDNDRIYYQLLDPGSITTAATGVPENTMPPFEQQLPLAQLSFDFDPVCGMKMDKTTLGDTAMYRKEMIGFCSDHCKHQFLKDPESYLSGTDLVVSDHGHM